MLNLQQQCSTDPYQVIKRWRCRKCIPRRETSGSHCTLLAAAMVFGVRRGGVAEAQHGHRHRCNGKKPSAGYGGGDCLLVLAMAECCKPLLLPHRRRHSPDAYITCRECCWERWRELQLGTYFEKPIRLHVLLEVTNWLMTRLCNIIIFNLSTMGTLRVG